MEELDAGDVVRVAGLEGRFEAEFAELTLEGAQAGASPRAATRLGAPDPPGLGGFTGVVPDALGERGEQAGEEGVRRRIEPEPGRSEPSKPPSSR